MHYSADIVLSESLKTVVLQMIYFQVIYQTEISIHVYFLNGTYYLWCPSQKYCIIVYIYMCSLLWLGLNDTSY